MNQPRSSHAPTSILPAANPLWFKEAIIYEIPIRAFKDSNGDGIGDIAGVISKLDYLADLGVTALWLLPFYPSPLLDGGYDIADYLSVHPMYGTLNDFKQLLSEAHDRGIRIITELVINHTSKDHPWFQKSRRSLPGDKWRDFYVWSDDPSLYPEARIIFKDFETSNWSWDAEARAYYWHRFYAHQPDLNFDNPAVHEAVFEAMDFWFELGVDGLRLDAIPYLYERAGTTCENLPETHAFLKKLRAHIDEKFDDRMLLAEANQWPEDAAAYFGEGDECHMNFHFPLMPRMFMAVQMEDRFPIVDILQQTPAIPDNCQWATFLRNHDELTLEMVTDEERDYMYKVYAEDPTARINLGIRRRLAPLLKTRQQMELMNALLFSLPGTPVLYYGDEIGMGDNIYLGDRDGVRTPMQWSADRNAGFSSANPQKLFLPVTTDPEYRYESVNVEAQQANPASLLWWTKRLIALRRHHPALSAGSLEFLHPDNARVLSFLRVLDDQKILVVANLSRLHQWVELDLSRFQGLVPVEMSGRVPFPRIAEAPYVVSLAPYGFIWFLLEPAATQSAAAAEIPTIYAHDSFDALFNPNNGKALESSLELYISARRWFRSKGRSLRATRIVDRLELADATPQYLCLVEISYAEGEPEIYAVPLVLLRGGDAREVADRAPHAIVAHLVDKRHGAPHEVVVADGLAAASCLPALLLAIVKNEAWTTFQGGRLTSFADEALASLVAQATIPTKVAELEQTNTTVVLGDQLLFKMYRQVAPGINPESEIGAFLATRGVKFPAPRLLGSLEYQSRAGDLASLAVVQEFVPNEGNAWELTLIRLQAYLEHVLGDSQAEPPEPAQSGLVERSRTPLDSHVQRMIGPFLQQIELLGRRIAEMHLALMGDEMTPAFAPEPFSTFHQQSIYQRAHGMLARTFDDLRKSPQGHTAGVQRLLAELLPRQAGIDRALRRMVKTKFGIVRIRCHGDLHLGQILYTGQDFCITDFEGEPARPLHERRYKRCPLRDVMGLLRSFNYATESVLRSGRYREDDLPRLRTWAGIWEDAVRDRVLCAYLEEIADAPFVPRDAHETDLLLEFFELEKVIYEIRYELQNRPDWLELPLSGLLAISSRFEATGYAS